VAKNYLDDFVAGLKEKKPQEKIVKSYLGRMRLLNREFGRHERSGAKATLLQQMEADIVRMAVMRLWVKFRNERMRNRIGMVIHDAVYVEAPEAEAQQARHWMKVIMKEAVEMPLVRLEIDLD